MRAWVHGITYLHSSISPPAQTGAVGDAGRGEITYGLVVAPQPAQRTGTRATALGSCLWQFYLHESPFLGLHMT